MLSGVPVVSHRPEGWGDDWGGADLFEGHEIACNHWYDDPVLARARLRAVVAGDYVGLKTWSRDQRQRAVELFGIDTIGAQWREFLS